MHETMFMLLSACLGLLVCQSTQHLVFQYKNRMTQTRAANFFQKNGN